MQKPIFALALLAACASAGPIPAGPKPLWVTQASADPRFPPDKFFAAIGTTTLGGKTGPELLAAVDAAARAELAATLQSTISSEVNSYESVRVTNGKTEEHLSADQRVKQVVQDFDLTAAISIEGRWRDGDIARAWAVLDKAKALTLQQGKVADKAKLAQDLVAQAATAAPADALRHLARARVEADAALGGLLLLRALGGKAEPTTTEADAQGRLATLLGSLVVTVVDGDHQRAAEGKGLSQPIVFSVWLGGKPAAGLPLAARIEGGRADDAAVVGPDGRVSLRVDDVGHFGTEQLIGLAIDWPRVLGVPAAKLPAWTVADSKPVASAVAVKKGIGTTRVLVLIQEKIEGGDAVSEPPVTASVTNALQTAGFALQDKKVFYERVRGDGVAKLDVEELKKQARGFADVVVFGTVTSRFSSNFGATTVWHRARADVRAIDVNTGQVVFQSGADETKGKRPGELNVAGRAALEAMGADLGPRLEKTLSGVASQ